MLADLSAHGTARCPRCDKPMLIDEKGYGCSNCRGFMLFDVETAPIEDVGIHQRFVLRERIAAEEKVADARRKLAHWLEKEAAIQARLEHERASETEEAVRWVRRRFSCPDEDDLDAMVREKVERDPSFAVLLKQAMGGSPRAGDGDDAGG